MEWFERIAVAFAIGLLIGVERGWRERDFAEGTRVAGVRTFALIALLGALWGLLVEELDTLLLGASFIAFSALVIVAHTLDVRRDQDYGITTAVAALITFTLGVTAARGHLALASTVGITTAIMLSLKPLLHLWLKTLREQELSAAFKLLLISVVILPALPDTGYGPWQALNPREIWWFVVLISAIAFVGYFIIKLAGARIGVALTGLLGGLVSSTMVTLNFARLARQHPLTAPLLISGIVMAAGTMFPRILLEVTLVNPALLPLLAAPLLVMTLVCYGSIPLLLRRASHSAIDVRIPLSNPFELLPALKFAALLVAIMLIARGLETWLGNSGIYLLAAIAGTNDVDAITLTLARQSNNGLAPHVAASAIVMAAMVNTLVKAGLALYLARRAARPVFVIFASAIAAGLVGLLLIGERYLP
ncbi:MAG TPA: MgtC/SapB family protein [Gammaproteobacteria bacterium]